MTDAAINERLPGSSARLYRNLFLALIALLVAVPLLATVLGGFKSLGELRTNPFGLPKVWEWQNYADILFSRRYWQIAAQLLCDRHHDHDPDHHRRRRWRLSCSPISSSSAAACC